MLIWLNISTGLSGVMHFPDPPNSEFLILGASKTVRKVKDEINHCQPDRIRISHSTLSDVIRFVFAHQWESISP